MTQVGIFPWSKPMPHTHANIGQGGQLPTIASILDIIHSHENDGEGSVLDHADLGNVLSAQHHALPNLSNIVNPCVCYASRNAAQTIPSGVATKILYDSELFDVGGNFAGSQFTTPSNGYYLIGSHGAFMNLPAGSDQTLDIRVAGAVVAKSQYEINVQATECYMECVSIRSLTTGQIISSYVRQNSGADKSLFGGVAQTYIVIVKLGA